MGMIGTEDAPPWRLGWRRQSRQAQDVDAHAEGLSGWQQCYDQLTAGPFRGELDELWTGPAQVYRERTSQALRQRCEVWADALWCGITAQQDGSRMEGRLVGESGVMVCGQSGQFELVSPKGHDLLGVVLSRSELQRHVQALGVSLDWSLLDRSPWLAVEPARRRLAQARLRAILSLAEQACSVHQRAEAARESLRQSMLDVVTDLLECPQEPGDERCNATVRRRLVSQVHDWVQAHPETVPSVPDLCLRLNVSRRTLQYAFEAEVAMSPKAYLRSIRLNAVRRALRRGQVGSITVQDVAAQWGFWSLSQFASDYRQQFGERPSDTLLRTASH
jgi:AraC family ethanolamine operon transcriptional activator